MTVCFSSAWCRLPLASAYVAIMSSLSMTALAGQFDGVYRGSGIVTSDGDAGKCYFPAHSTMFVYDDRFEMEGANVGFKYTGAITDDGKLDSQVGAAHLTGSISGPTMSAQIKSGTCTLALTLTKAGTSSRAPAGLVSEQADWGLPSEDATIHTDNMASETPVGVPGGHTLTTKQFIRLINSRPPTGMVVIDVGDRDDGKTIPGAILRDDFGIGFSLDDETQGRVAAALDEYSLANRDVPVVVFGFSVASWSARNAAFRAAAAGYRHVYWYRGGLAAWEAAGLRLVEQ
jgi:rhodanese-related sulfurtransferase